MHKAALFPALLTVAALPPAVHAAAGGSNPEANVIEGVVAEVGGEPVTMQEVMEDVRAELLKDGGKHGGDSRQLPAV